MTDDYTQFARSILAGLTYSAMGLEGVCAEYGADYEDMGDYILIDTSAVFDLECFTSECEALGIYPTLHTSMNFDRL
jgi:predicted methyltransferase MtxX (methanogen marker protein 4)